MSFSFKKYRQAGLALPELLVGVFVLGTLTVSIVSLAVLGTRTAFVNEQRTVAQALANEDAERIRAMPYEVVGYTAAAPCEETDAICEPDGELLQSEDAFRNGQRYHITRTISLVDDPFNGCVVDDQAFCDGLVGAGGPAQLTEDNADYKQVYLTIDLPASGSGQQSTAQQAVQLGLYAVPGGDLPPTPTPDPSPPVTPNPTPICDPSGEGCPGGWQCDTGTLLCEPIPSPVCDPFGGGCPSGHTCNSSYICEPPTTPTPGVTPGTSPTPGVTPGVTPGTSPTPGVTPGVTPTPTTTPPPSPECDQFGNGCAPGWTCDLDVFICVQDPTPTPNPSVTPGFTPTPGASTSPTPGVTPSVTPGTSPTPGVTPSVTPGTSPTPGVTPSVTPSPTQGGSPSPTPTGTGPFDPPSSSPGASSDPSSPGPSCPDIGIDAGISCPDDLWIYDCDLFGTQNIYHYWYEQLDLPLVPPACTAMPDGCSVCLDSVPWCGTGFEVIPCPPPTPDPDPTPRPFEIDWQFEHVIIFTDNTVDTRNNYSNPGSVPNSPWTVGGGTGGLVTFDFETGGQFDQTGALACGGDWREAAGIAQGDFFLPRAKELTITFSGQGPTCVPWTILGQPYGRVRIDVTVGGETFRATGPATNTTSANPPCYAAEACTTDAIVGVPQDPSEMVNGAPLTRTVTLPRGNNNISISVDGGGDFIGDGQRFNVSFSFQDAP